MRTYTFIGSDKNAGKTTAMNFVYGELCREKPANRDICLTAIGINGEAVDTFDNREKPEINLSENTLFMTASSHLEGLAGSYRAITRVSGPGFTKPYTLARATGNLKLVLEGPNDRTGIRMFRDIVRQYNDRTICLIDGSIDRHFIGHPDISDGIFYSLLVTDCPEQQAKLRDFLFAITLPDADPATRALIPENRLGKSKSLLIAKSGEIIHQGFEVPFLDAVLKDKIRLTAKEWMLLYLEGALSRTLHDFLAPFSRLTVVLDSFTRYLNISTDAARDRIFKPKLMTRYAVPVIGFFLNPQTDQYCPPLPAGIPVIDLYGDCPEPGTVKIRTLMNV